MRGLIVFLCATLAASTTHAEFQGEVLHAIPHDHLPEQPASIPMTSRLETLDAKIDDAGDIEAFNELDGPEDEEGFIDSVFGAGTQSRIVASVNGWVTEKAKTNPGCVERFVCETYRTGESMTGFPYFFMQLTNAAVSFMVAEMFDQTIDIQEITRAARYGRTIGTCHTMKCEIMDNGQLRTLGDYLDSIDDFVTSIVKTVYNSVQLG